MYVDMKCWDVKMGQKHSLAGGYDVFLQCLHADKQTYYHYYYTTSFTGSQQ